MATGALINMKEIRLLRRTHVERIGVCESETKTTCRDGTAAHLVKSGFAEYAAEKDAKAAEAEAKKAEAAANK